jgi:hypothetical protein
MQPDKLPTTNMFSSTSKETQVCSADVLSSQLGTVYRQKSSAVYTPADLTPLTGDRVHAITSSHPISLLYEAKSKPLNHS